jgi:D-alanyl-D-alanine dipeptidase
MSSQHARRLARAAEVAAREGLSALLITPSADLLYLTGYDPLPLPRLTCLVLRPEKDPVLVVPSLERPLARDAGAERLAEVVDWGETEDPYGVVARVVGEDGVLGCSDRMWAAHLLLLQGSLANAQFVSASGVLGPMRSIKDDQELGFLRRAARAADETFRRIGQTRLEGRTERDVADQLAELLIQMGHEKTAFTIVGSGPNAASPHHEPGGRTIQAAEAVVMDFGGRVSGYCSDLTRTVVIRQPPREFGHVYEVVREAQDRAFRAVKPGVPAEAIDRAARQVIEAGGFGDLFIHRTGHGIGLEVHEDPYLVAGNREPLRPGMCFSIEPGVYLPGQFGVRIEDIVVVTEEGAQRLNHAERDLQVVG